MKSIQANRIISLLAAFTFFAGLAYSAEQSKECDWCVITCPESAKEGEEFEVKITIKEAGEGLKLAGDLHLNKADGSYGGYGYWGGDPKSVKAGDTLTLKYKMIKKDGNGGVHVLFYLTQSDFKNAKKKAYSPVVKMQAAE